MNYQTFLERKKFMDEATGLATIPDLAPHLFGFQRDIVTWALTRGRAAIFADCGLGKTPMQLEWARHIPGRVLIAAPLAVSAQTVRESAKFGIDGVKYLRADDGETRIVVTNYEMLEYFNPADFTGIVLDESSILKSYTGKLKQQIISDWGKIRFRLACTATPAPNDYMELGNHSEFLGVMSGSEMLSAFFINDPGHVGRYRIKGHAREPFFDWMGGWSAMVRKPSDLGYDDDGFALPEMALSEHIVEPHAPADGMLFELDAHTMSERQSARRNSIADRVEKVAELANADRGEPWLIWCDLNSESEQLVKSIEGAVEVRGSDKPSVKEDRLLGFADGTYRVLVTKPTIAGFGMNYQHCARMAFTGLSDSFEQYYQAVRRCWRFGQKREVQVHVVISRTEGAVAANIKRKERQAKEIADGLSGRINAGRKSGFTKPYEASQKFKLPSFLS